MVVIDFNLFKRYDVALSFAEENRAFVDRVAKLLKEQGIKVFYDDDLRITSWGQDLKKYLDKVYRLQARFCVVFVSKDYEQKRWTNFEIKRADARSFFAQKQAYVLPYLLDESEYSEQFKDVGCLTYKTHDEQQLVDAIIEKLDRQLSRRLVIWFRDLYRVKLRFAAAITLVVGSSALGLKDHLTPVDILTRQLHERSGHKVKGTKCKDGWFSRSHGSGTCSYHKGIDQPKDSVIYDKSLEQCQIEAEEISWIPD